ncbi:glycosyltransferase family 2 protein [Canibacter zhoujuaniae]|uniref:glycosyltransferase family 2 protein n=1 Tax=Canibacter zhoujuaniae TaxID=2708343 RepID=UPI0014248CC9|nr:glycosyltransferase [Canibacter zhoujuaniae]
MQRPDITIVVPVHDKERPIRRAVESILLDERAIPLVIAHNLQPAELDLPADPRVRVVELAGSKGMPGACFDLGIAEAETEWVGIMGSDDWFEQGALAAMRKRAATDGADAVIAPLKNQGTPSNVIRPLTLRKKNLRAARDRVFYRTAPLGIYKTAVMRKPEYRFGAVFPAGSDMRVTAALWTSGHKVSYYWNDPAYVVGADAKTRVTFTPRPLDFTGAPYLGLFEEDAVKRFSAAEKHALAVKMVNVHVMSAVMLRPNKSDWQGNDFVWLCDYVEKLKQFDPRLHRAISRRDRWILQALYERNIDMLVEANQRRLHARMWNKLLPVNVFWALADRQAALRLAIVGVLAARSTRF